MVTTPLRPSRPARGSSQPGPARHTGSTRAPEAGPSAADRSGLIQRLWRLVEGRAATQSSYLLILACTIALTCIGLIMVLSSSSVENIDSAGGSYALFLRQGLFALVGLGMMFTLSRLTVSTLRRLAWPAIMLSLVLLLLVLTPLGHEVNGNQNWIQIGGFTAQPSEAAKLALCLWAAAVLERKGRLVGHLQHAIVPVLFPVGAVMLGLVLWGRDLGTALVLMLILAAALFLAGTRMRYFIIAAILGALGAIVMALASPNRMVRVQAWLGNCEHPSDPCFQPDHGMYALASGGWWGLGLGQSRQKWSYIPEAENDFIFTILGEELGLAGTLLVLALFAGLAVGAYRVARNADSQFVRIASGAIMAWLVGQAFVNIAMVTGLLPVIGVPLPFISSGGSALTLALAAVGVLLAFARHERRITQQAEETGETGGAGGAGETADPDGTTTAVTAPQEGRA